MYAIVQHGGRQYRLTPGDKVLVDRLESPVGSVVALGPVLFLSEGSGAGKTAGEGVRVAATVLSHLRGPKLRVFTYKAKKRTRRTHGHRSDLTELEVTSVLKAGQDPHAAKAKAAEKPGEKDGA